MKVPRTCDACGCSLDADEICTCKAEAAQSASMEFVMGTDLEKALPKTIDFNFEELKVALAQSLDHYNGLVVTEDDIKGAKGDRTKLNNLREALETKRKDIKKECMAPYTDFEAKVKELVGLIDKPIAAIDGQLKTFEDQRKANKRADILAIYEETVGEIRALLPFDKLWRDEWYNTGVSMKKIREAIVAAEDKSASDLEVLSTVESEFAEAVKLKYLEALDLNAALVGRARLQQQAARLREYEEQRAKSAATPPRVAYAVSPTATDDQARDAAPDAPDGACKANSEDTAQVYLLRFECQVTKEQAGELAAWLKARNISYRRV